MQFNWPNCWEGMLLSGVCGEEVKCDSTKNGCAGSCRLWNKWESQNVKSPETFAKHFMGSIKYLCTFKRMTLQGTKLRSLSCFSCLEMMFNDQLFRNWPIKRTFLKHSYLQLMNSELASLQEKLEDTVQKKEKIDQFLVNSKGIFRQQVRARKGI